MTEFVCHSQNRSGGPPPMTSKRQPITVGARTNVHSITPWTATTVIPLPDPNRPIGNLTPTPPTGPSTSDANPAANILGEILEKTVTKTIYSWTCNKCRRTLHHRDRGTLEHNLAEHLEQRHSIEAERRCQLSDIQKLVRKVERSLNRRFG